MANEKSGENLLDVEHGVIDQSFIYAIKSFKTVLPQIQAAIIVTTFSLTAAEGIAFPGVLISDLKKTNSPFNLTMSESSWIASTSSLTMAIGGFIAGFMADYFGRLNTIRMSVIPWSIGWCTTALSNSFTMFLIGRVLIGISLIMGSTSVVAYISEIGWPAIRGMLFISTCITAALGVELLYLKRLFMSWRTIAWSQFAFNIFNLVLTFSIHESPVWLTRKGKIKEARKSLEWLHKYQIASSVNQSNAEIHLSILKYQDKIEQEIKSRQKKQTCCSMIWKPEIYKPALVLVTLFFIQQFSGLYVMQAYAISFFEKIGGKIDPLVSSNIVSGLPVIISFLNLYTVKRFGRIKLLMASCLGASICLFISALFTKWIQEGSSSQDWIPIFFIFLYMAMEIVGLETLPWVMAGELLPQNMRGFLLSIMYSMSTLLMFGALYSYQYLDIIFGSAGIQFFYGSVAFLGTFFVYFFLPETHGKTLFEIENYFK